MGRLSLPSLLLPVVFLVAFAVQWHTRAWTDLAWLTWGADEILKGGELYRDIYEPNPPLIYWLYLPIVRLAKNAAWDHVVALRMAAIPLIAAATGISAFLLRRSDLWQGANSRSFLLALATLMLLMPDALETFAQREHLFIVFSLPYFLMYLPSIARDRIPSWLKTALGFAAGIGFCLKPHFFIPWIALLLYKYASTRSLRRTVEAPEAAVLATAVAYVAAIAAWVPQTFAWGNIMLQLYHQAGRIDQTALDKIMALGFIALVAVFFLYRCRLWEGGRQGHGKDDVRYLLWIALAMFLEGLLQFKTWNYIIYPGRMYGLAALAAVAILRPLPGFLVFALFAWSFAPLLPINDSRQLQMHQNYSAIAPLLAPHHGTKNLHYFSLAFAHPALYRIEPPLRWSSAFGFYNFLLMGIMETNEESGQPSLTPRPGKEELECWLLARIADDLEKKRPGVILIHRVWRINTPAAHAFDFLAWMQKEPRLRHFLRHYTLRDAMNDDGSFPGWRNNYRLLTPVH